MWQKPFNAADWYWIVAGDTDEPYSSSRNNYVPSDDAAFVAWGEDGTLPTQIDTAAELGAVLAGYLLEPIPADVLEGYVAALAADPAIAVAYDHEVRLCNLEGTEPPDIGAFAMKQRGRAR